MFRLRALPCGCEFSGEGRGAGLRELPQKSDHPRGGPGSNLQSETSGTRKERGLPHSTRHFLIFRIFRSCTYVATLAVFPSRGPCLSDTLKAQAQNFCS